MSQNELTWTCHGCGATRPDDKISVHTIDMSAKYNMAKGVMTRNFRHCNDNSTCLEIVVAKGLEEMVPD